MGIIAVLDNMVMYYEQKTGFEHGRIEVYEEDDDDGYGIDIDETPYSNYLTEDEAEDTIRCLFQGIALAKGIKI